MLLPEGLHSTDFVRFRWPQILLLALAVAAAAAFAATAPWPYRATEPQLQGRLTIVGARDMAHLVDRWAAIFHREHPAVDVIVAPAGSGAAAGAMADGVADVAPLARPLSQTERVVAAAASRNLRGVVVGFHPASASRRRPLVIYLNQGLDTPPSGVATEFVRVALSSEGQRQIAAGALSGAERARTLSALQNLAGRAPAMVP